MILHLFIRLPFSADKMRILAPLNEKGARKWIIEIEYTLEVKPLPIQTSDTAPTIPQNSQVVSLEFKKPTLKAKSEQNKPTYEESFAASITTVKDPLKGHQNENRPTSNYKNFVELQELNVENFNKDISLAIRFDQTRIKYAKQPFFQSNLKLNLSPSEKDSTTKSTKEYSKETIEEEINKLDSKVNSRDAGVGASLKVYGFDLGGGVSYAKKMGEENETSDSKSKIKLSDKENKLWTRYTGKFTMPPKTGSMTTDQILSHEAMKGLNEVKDFRTAYKYVEEFGSHYLETTYHLGGYYAEEVDASLDNVTNQSQGDTSRNNQTNFDANLNVASFGKANASYGNSQNTSTGINTSSSISKTNINANKKSSVDSALTSVDFHRMLDEDIYVSKEMDSDRKATLRAFKNVNKEPKEFERYFKPIWKYLSVFEDNNGSSTQKRVFLLIKIMCKFSERLYFFRLNFEEIFSSRNDVNLVSKYLDSLESYFLKKLDDQFNCNENVGIDIDDKLAAIFNAELNKNSHLHRNLLNILDSNRIKFVDKCETIAKLIQEHPNKFWYMAFYNQKFQANKKDEWNRTLDHLITFSSSMNKCAVFDCDWHDEKEYGEEYFGKVWRWEHGDLKEVVLENQAENSNSRYFKLFIKSSSF
jgi:hypothetical protein